MQGRMLAWMLLALALVVAPACPSFAQGAKDAPPKPAAPAPDALGRDSPRGTITGLSRAARRGEFALAARYVQTRGRGPREAEAAARDVSELLDRYFTQPISTLSALPEGRLDDGLAPNEEKLALRVGDRTVDILLVRVQEGTAPPIWLVSSQSLAEAAALHRSPAETLLERHVPSYILDRTLLGIPVAQWGLLAASLLVPLAICAGLALLATALLRRRATEGPNAALVRHAWASIQWPLVGTLAVAAHLLQVPLLGFGLSFRVAYARGGALVLVILLAMLLWRVLSASFTYGHVIASAQGRSAASSLILLGERVVKALLLIATVIALLGVAGVNTSAALAGLGIGGIALALGAKKSVENLLGGMLLLTDKALAVGDYCRVEGRLGWIEDITLRSVRLRTVEQTLLSVPAGVVSEGQLENFATRRKILMEHRLQLRHGTSTEQLRCALDGMRDVLAAEARLEPGTPRARLVDFSPRAIEVELYAYVMTGNHVEFLSIREQLLLAVASALEAAGTGFADPAQWIQQRAEADREGKPPAP